jgi:hypothetical protein
VNRRATPAAVQDLVTQTALSQRVEELRARMIKYVANEHAVRQPSAPVAAADGGRTRRRLCQRTASRRGRCTTGTRLSLWTRCAAAASQALPACRMTHRDQIIVKPALPALAVPSAQSSVAALMKQAEARRALLGSRASAPDSPGKLAAAVVRMAGRGAAEGCVRRAQRTRLRRHGRLPSHPCPRRPSGACTRWHAMAQPAPSLMPSPCRSAPNTPRQPPAMDMLSPSVTEGSAVRRPAAPWRPVCALVYAMLIRARACVCACVCPKADSHRAVAFADGSREQRGARGHRPGTAGPRARQVRASHGG